MMQVVSTGVVNLDQISYQISKECTLSKVDVKMVLYALGEKSQFHLEGEKIPFKFSAFGSIKTMA
ncbi:HU family DNA-binding protein [Lutibacter litoralis]|uniref:HU domain-containing protein n=1 Tax=Lutibacter litoralis TaxID=321268 RepID=A0ABV5JYT1_9FLAO|nr:MULTISPECIES: hypothetical protein [Flavobacteriaceae]